MNRGDDLFIDEMAQHVFYLMKNFRVKDEKFREYLGNLQTGEVTESDTENLTNLYFLNHTKDKKDKIKNDPRTIWLFTKNAKGRTKHTAKLV